MADFYYTDASRQPAGPVPYEQLKGMHDRGELADGALAAEVGATEWQPVASMFGQPITGDVGYSAPPISPAGPITGNGDEFEPLAGWAFGMGMATWVCFGIFSAIPGVILGHMALSKLKRTGNTNGTSRVLAIIGLVASYAYFAIIAVVLVLGLSFGLLGAFGP